MNGITTPPGGSHDAPAGNASASWSRRAIWMRLLLYPTHTLPTAAAPVLVAVGLAVRDHVFAPGAVALAFLGSWLIHIAGVFFDNHELLRKHGEVLEHPELLQALRGGTLTLRALRWAILACLAGSVLAGVWLVATGGTLAVMLGVIGVAASLSYAGGPLAYARRGLAEPIFFLMFGVVAIAGTYFIQSAALHGPPPPGLPEAVLALPVDVFFVGLPVGALITNVLIIDDMRDVAFDAAKGWRTGAVRFGIAWSRVRHVLLYVFAYLAPPVFYFFSDRRASLLLPLLTLPWAWSIVRTVCTRTGAEALGPMTPRASMLSLGYAFFLAIGIAISAR